MSIENNLQDIEVDVEGFPLIGAESVLTPPQASIFKRTEAGFKFDPPTEGENTPAKEDSITPTETTTTVKDENISSLFDEIVKEDNAEPEVVKDDRPEATGRAKTDKSALVDYIKSKIDTKDFVTFDDYDEKLPIEEYLSNLSNKDLNALVDENLKLKEETFKKEVPQQFYEMLPEDFKIAYEYISNGGQDLKGLYKALSQVQDLKDLDPANENHQEEIVYEYLRNANVDWSDDEVKGQVEEWKDLGLIEKKASQLKPKLDKMKEQIVQYQLEEQKQVAEQRKQAAQTYISNVYEALKPAEINGLKIDTKTQATLYNGLVNANYKSMAGGQTNLLGHLLEKNQYGENKNYALISKVLWLLNDEKGFEEALMKKGSTTTVETIVKKLKTEQGNRSSSVSFEDEGNASRIKTKIVRQANPFQRS